MNRREDAGQCGQRLERLKEVFMADIHLARQAKDVVTAVPMSAARVVARHPGRLLWVIGALVLLVMAVLAHGEPQFPGDAAISAALQRLRVTGFAPLLNFPSDINQPLPGAILAIAIIVTLAVLRRMIEALVLAVATFGTDLINAVLNGLVARPRPHHVQVATVSGLGAHSFPSGHVEHVSMLFGFLFFLTLFARRARPDRWIWLLPLQVICLYFIAMVGVGRVMEGVHQPSDVAAGYLVAALTLPLAVLSYRRLVS
jgi:membrane-associated phospholipid phosphatase